MKETVKFGLILGIICVVSAGLLSGVNLLTKPKILAQALAEENAGLKEVLPGAERFEEKRAQEKVIYFKGYDKAGQLVGFAFKAIGRGYAGDVEVLAGIQKNGKITAIKIISQAETPGLGARITDRSFIDQFKGKDNLSEVQAITGATISSRAVILSVEKKAAEVLKIIKDEK